MDAQRGDRLTMYCTATMNPKKTLWPDSAELAVATDHQRTIALVGQAANGRRAIVSPEDFEFLSQWKWNIIPKGYAIRTDRSTGSKRTVYMHIEVARRCGIAKDGLQVDHRNKNKLDNTRRNLRAATNQLNQANVALQRNNTSGFKGVHFHKLSKKFVARIGVGRTRIQLGKFDSAEEAHRAYCAAAAQCFGEFACNGEKQMAAWNLPSSNSGLSNHQREQLGKCTATPVGVLGGSPGTGKTFASAMVIKDIVGRYGTSQVAVAAATGKAAQRITEAMLEHGLTDIPATTIHRLLGVSRNGHDKGGWGFIHNRANPLQKKFIFIDEASMLSCPLAASLLEACQPGTHLLFIGDFAQLPPVEHGAPLRDMIAAGLPYGELTEIHRNAGDLVIACRDLKEGRPFTPSQNLDTANGKNLLHLEAARPSLALGALSSLIRNVPAGINPAWDIQVLCAVNEKSDVARKSLNRILQGILNPNGATAAEGGHFRLDDKVICLTNGMLPLLRCTNLAGCPDPEGQVSVDKGLFTCGACNRTWKPKEAISDFVANGEIGRVVLVAKGAIHVAFESPLRTVRVAGEWLRDFDLAYAITTHKSQGSQWPYIICMADDSNGADHVTSWEWWRTALSRAQTACFTIGRKSAIDRQCRKSALAPRKTFLAEMLKEHAHGAL